MCPGGGRSGKWCAKGHTTLGRYTFNVFSYMVLLLSAFSALKKINVEYRGMEYLCIFCNREVKEEIVISTLQKDKVTRTILLTFVACMQDLRETSMHNHDHTHASYKKNAVISKCN